MYCVLSIVHFSESHVIFPAVMAVCPVSTLSVQPVFHYFLPFSPARHPLLPVSDYSVWISGSESFTIFGLFLDHRPTNSEFDSMAGRVTAFTPSKCISECVVCCCFFFLLSSEPQITVANSCDVRCPLTLEAGQDKLKKGDKRRNLRENHR